MVETDWEARSRGCVHPFGFIYCLKVFLIEELLIYLIVSNQSILKEINPGVSLEGMMLKLKLQYFGHFMRRVDSLEDSDAGRDWGQEEKGTTEDEMAGWHHRLDGLSELREMVMDRPGVLRFMGSQRVGHD